MGTSGRYDGKSGVGCIGTAMGELRKYGKHKYWTEEEVETLKNLSTKKTAVEISRIMNRSLDSVICKQMNMHIPNYMKTTENINGSDIGRIVGQNKSSIYRRWRRHGLPLKPFGRCLVVSEKELVEFMRKNPKLWSASQCDYYFFSKYDWFLERLKEERIGKKAKDR